MRKTIVLFLSLSLTGCATIHRHPTATKVAIVSLGLAVGLAAGLATKGVHCPPIYDGKPYNGTSPGCPK